MFRLLSFLLFLYISQHIIKGASDDSYTRAECGIVINDENQARECLDSLPSLGSNDTAPLPVFLETVPDSDFICKNRTPPYIFYCTVHGNDLLWDFNNNLDNLVTGFQPSNMLGRTRSKIYNDSGLEYNVTAILTWVSKRIEDNNISIPICSSVLTVEPLSESNLEVIPSFTVSCLTYCQASLNRSRICQSKQFAVAETPSKPREVTGNITYTAGVGDSVVSVSWLPPANKNETTIDYYELRLTGLNTSNTTFRVHTAASLPFKVVVPEGNFSTASVTAVDLCGQKSISLPSALTIIPTVSPTCPNTCNIERQEIPSKPRDVTGNITSATCVGGSVISVSWLPPANQNETTIDYYELTLTGPNTSSTTFRVHIAASLPYYVKVSAGNYTATVTAVDVCRQKSGSSQLTRLNFISGSSPSPNACNIERQEQLQSTVTGLAVPLAAVSSLLAVAVIVIVVLVFNRLRHDEAGGGHDIGGVDLHRYSEARADQHGDGEAEVDQHGDGEAGVDQHGGGEAEVDQHGDGEAEVDQHGDGKAEVDQHGDGEAGVDQHGSGEAEVDQHGDGEAGVDQHGGGEAGVDQHGDGEAEVDQHGGGEARVDQHGGGEARVDQHGGGEVIRYDGTDNISGV